MSRRFRNRPDFGLSLRSQASSLRPREAPPETPRHEPSELIQKNSTFSRYFLLFKIFLRRRALPPTPRSNLRQSAQSAVPPPASSRRAFRLGESPQETIRPQ